MQGKDLMNSGEFSGEEVHEDLVSEDILRQVANPFDMYDLHRGLELLDISLNRMSVKEYKRYQERRMLPDHLKNPSKVFLVWVDYDFTLDEGGTGTLFNVVIAPTRNKARYYFSQNWKESSWSFQSQLITDMFNDINRTGWTDAKTGIEYETLYSYKDVRSCKLKPDLIYFGTRFATLLDFDLRNAAKFARPDFFPSKLNLTPVNNSDLGKSWLKALLRGKHE